MSTEEKKKKKELGYIQRVAPSYPLPIFTFSVNDLNTFYNWFDNIASQHANFVKNGSYTPVKISNSTFNNAITHVGRHQEVQKTLYFICDHAGKPLKKNNAEQNQPKKRQRTNPTIKVDCKAKIECRILLDNTCEVIYHWQHSSHDPTEYSELKKSRLPTEVKNWINEHVEKNMDWNAFKDLLRLSPEELQEAENDDSKVPLSLLVNASDVQNAILAKLSKSSRKAYIDKESVLLWFDELRKREYHVLQHIYSSSFVIAWVSPWQKLILQRQEDICIDSTHKTCKSFLNDEDCYLFTIVAKNSSTNKGYPLGFMITNSETSETVSMWLEWLKKEVEFTPKTIMIDCSPIEINAIRVVFQESVQILLCHWHIKRAWDKKIKKDVKASTGTKDSMILRSEAHSDLNKLMHCENQDDFEVLWGEFVIKWRDNKGCLEFCAYMLSRWYPKKELWCKTWRSSWSFHTNNYVESWHNQLKSFYLGRSRCCRVDRIVYTLVELVEIDYRQHALQVKYGFKHMSLSAHEKQRKKEANKIDFNIANSMIVFENGVLYCRSFTDCGKWYIVNYKNNENGQLLLSTCSCPDFEYSRKLCKHIFLINRIKSIPYQVQHITTQNNQVSSSSSSLSPSLPSSSSSLPLPSFYETRLLDLQDATFQEYNRNAKLFLQNYKKLDCNQLEQIGAILKQSASSFEKIINPQKGPEKQK